MAFSKVPYNTPVLWLLIMNFVKVMLGFLKQDRSRYLNRVARQNMMNVVKGARELQNAQSVIMYILKNDGIVLSMSSTPMSSQYYKLITRYCAVHVE